MAKLAKRIGILIYEDFSLVEVSSISEVFSLANEVKLGASDDERALAHIDGHDSPNYSLQFVSSEGGSVASSCSMRIWTESLETRWMNECDALFIAGGPGAGRARHDAALKKRLGRVAPKIPFIKAIGDGAHLLAAANLTLQNRSLDFADEPEEALTPALSPAMSSALFIAEQTLTLDDPKGPIAAALSIVKRDHGAAVAREVSERTVPGAWQKFATVLEDTDDGGVRQKIDAAARWIRENYVKPISITDAARVAAMSERNFLRRFKAQIGLTPSEYLLRARLDASCMLLAATDLPVDKIARRCGAGSGDGLAKIFRKRLSISPTEYRMAGRRKSESQ
ncbi:Transcriptional regulator containing an amidase domain and an AraC-type DNA-binding HTH domain [Candidatus Burkholderia verschuerenii]|uniref:Transcriptional regulator containing an amidase domain and an AraC-type DNA-binding HTH domain n=1 Tax=Candidatus Burkholderia verschuerenii TaxID=242163 RepID=A0A0L0MBR1_9BURK|nr:helix-turn-helix domain-containing protein [Candidatus Burkholderia verschuerenii]KND60137.1 Transcriptional regulator containing an amidase domain and an AraC-type DNA-binding HTH domain [Candidatus Burkholderia verschuerenii]